MTRAVWILCATVLALWPDESRAQTAASPFRWVEIDFGLGLLAGAQAGSSDANLRANERTEVPYRLFSTESDFGRAGEWHLRAARPLTGRWTIEGGVTVSRPLLRTETSADVEGAPSMTISETVDQYFFDAGVRVALDELRIGRATPFAAAGAGYLRQLHEGQTAIEHGQVFHAGGGVTIPLLTRAVGLIRTTGVRAAARAYMMRGGVSIEERLRPHVAVSGSVFVGF